MAFAAVWGASRRRQGSTGTQGSGEPGASVWFATFGSGVYRFDGETWTHLSTADGLAHNNVRAIAVAPGALDGTGFTL
jgi:hypothetical protein